MPSIDKTLFANPMNIAALKVEETLMALPDVRS